MYILKVLLEDLLIKIFTFLETDIRNTDNKVFLDLYNTYIDSINILQESPIRNFDELDNKKASLDQLNKLQDDEEEDEEEESTTVLRLDEARRLEGSTVNDATELNRVTTLGFNRNEPDGYLIGQKHVLSLHGAVADNSTIDADEHNAFGETDSDSSDDDDNEEDV